MPRHKSTKIKEIVDSLERPAVGPVGTEPAKPKRDLKDEYKEPWKVQKEREERLERVRRGDGDLRPDLKEPWLRPRSALSTGSSVHSRSGEESEAGQDGKQKPQVNLKCLSCEKVVSQVIETDK